MCIFILSYMWVCPDGGVVVCSINTDQTDGTWRRFTGSKKDFELNSPSQLRCLKVVAKRLIMK